MPSSSTATIRVPKETRDRLAAQAAARGVSLSAMVTQLAWRAEREAAFASERDATRADIAEPSVAEEERDWDATLGDGIG